MSIVGSLGTPDIRRRVPSSHHHHESSIRVVSCSSSAPRSSEVRPYARRKPVVLSDSDDEETKVVDVVRASNSLRDQVSGPTQSKRPTSSAAAPLPLSPLLPSPIIGGAHGPDKTKWSDQPFDYEEQDVVDASFAESVIVDQSIADLSGGNHLSQTQLKDEPSFLSASSASITLESIGRSLQWTQKFPQGRHLSRAKSRTTLRSTDSVTAISADDGKGTSKDMLAEARAGLRLLAKRREDVLQDQDDLTPSRVAKWNYFKWSLFLSVLVVFAYGILGLIGSLLTWAGAWNGAEVSVTVDTDIVICACSGRDIADGKPHS